MTELGICSLALALVLGPCSRAPSDEAASRSTPEPEVTPKSAVEPEPKVEPEPESTVEPEPKAEPEPAPGPTFTVIARLVDTGQRVSHCGVIHYKPVMKFEVLRVVEGRFEQTTLYAGVSCPEMPPTRARGFRWTEGATYEVRLRSAGLRRAGTLFDAFKDEPGKRYELLHIEPVDEAPAQQD